MTAWYVSPVDNLFRLAYNVYYTRGMRDACKAVLRMAQAREGLQEILRLPLSVDHLALPWDKEDASEDYTLLTGLLDEEARHAYIRGKYDCRGQIGRIIGETDEETLRHITAYCEAVVDITGGNNRDDP